MTAEDDTPYPPALSPAMTHSHMGTKMATQLQFLSQISQDFAKATDPKNGDAGTAHKVKMADHLSEMIAFANYLCERYAVLSGKTGSSSGQKITLSMAECLCELYLDWYTKVSSLLVVIDENDVEVSNDASLASLRKNHREVGAMIDHLGALERRVKDLKGGAGVPLEDALNALGTKFSPRSSQQAGAPACAIAH